MYKDPIAEMQYREGAVKIAARIMLQHQGKDSNGLDTTLILGLTMSPDTLFTKDIKGHELWECEMILIPIRKLRSKKTYGWLAENMLDEALGNESLWEEISKKGG